MHVPAFCEEDPHLRETTHQFFVESGIRVASICNFFAACEDRKHVVEEGLEVEDVIVELQVHSIADSP